MDDKFLSLQRLLRVTVLIIRIASSHSIPLTGLILARELKLFLPVSTLSRALPCRVICNRLWYPRNTGSWIPLLMCWGSSGWAAGYNWCSLRSGVSSSASMQSPFGPIFLNINDINGTYVIVYNYLYVFIYYILLYLSYMNIYLLYINMLVKVY